MTTYGPYSSLRRAGSLVFVAGQVGIHPETGKAPADIAGQTERALLNLENTLQKGGIELSNVVQVTVYLTNIDDFEAMNKVYELRFDNPRPARSTVGVRELPRLAADTPLLIELEAVAHKELK